jgi:hypothetical protein
VFCKKFNANIICIKYKLNLCVVKDNKSYYLINAIILLIISRDILIEYNR